MAKKSSSKIALASSKSDPKVPKSGTRATDSKFELIAELGRGGMATVYLARAKKRPDKLVVLKQLRADLAENPEFLAMFLEEARLAGKLQHPNIVETYEVGQDAGTYYIAMEYLEGLSLQAVLTKFGWKGEFSFSLQVFVLIEALKALEQAYTQRDDDGTSLKIVHRDVSPPNIIITFDGQVKLVDFGIAKAANSHVETRTGLIKGKLTYMAPEQAASGDVDSRTDIYSVGVMLWQAAAGRRRWKGVENTEVLKRLHAGEVSESPDAKKNGLPAIVDDIVLKAIAADPEQRFKSASAFRAALESLLRELDVDPSAKKLAAFMAKHFGDARKRAADVMKARITQLDEARGPEPIDSETAIRASVVKGPSKTKGASVVSGEKRKVADAPDENAQVGGAAAALSKKLSRPTTPAKIESVSRDSAPENTPTKASSAPRKSYAVPIAVIGIAMAVVLAFFALRSGRAETVAPAPEPTAAAPTGANDSPTPPSATPSSGPPATAAVATPLGQDTANASQLHAPSQHRHGHGPSTTTATPPVPVAQPAAISPPTSTPMATPTAPPVAPRVATPQPADTDHPSLDKQDPWKRNIGVEKSDPWASPQSAPSTHSPDPWAK